MRFLDRLLGLKTEPPAELAQIVPWPLVPDAWLVDYIVWRINSGKAEDRPKNVPLAVPKYANGVLYWVIWRRKGQPDPRPKVPLKIPKWGYETLDAVNPRAPIQIPSVLASWMLSWCIARFSNQPYPPNVPKDVSVAAPYCWSVLNWMAWQRRRLTNPAAPRPTNIPASIPPACWSLLKQVNRAVPVIVGPPPPPPPPPGPPKPANTFAGIPFPIMFVSWGPLNDSRYRDNDEAIKDMVNAGVKTVLGQVQGGTALFRDDFPTKCRAHGLKFGVWGIAHPNDVEILALSHADCYVPQVETPDQYQALMVNMRAGVGASIPRSTVSTLYGFNTFTHRPPTEQYPEGQLTTTEYEEMRPFITHGLIECYVQEGGAHFPIINMMFAAGQRGFDYFNPTIGMYHESSFTQYRPTNDPTTLDSYGKQIAVYLAEGMTTANWAELAALGT